MDKHLIIPEGYTSDLDLYETQIGIKTVKDFFQQTLAKQLMQKLQVYEHQQELTKSLY